MKNVPERRKDPLRARSDLWLDALSTPSSAAVGRAMVTFSHACLGLPHCHADRACVESVSRQGVRGSKDAVIPRRCWVLVSLVSTGRLGRRLGWFPRWSLAFPVGGIAGYALEPARCVCRRQPCLLDALMAVEGCLGIDP